MVGGRRATQIGWAQKNRFRNRSGEKAENQKSERVNARNDLTVVSQDSFQASPALHQVSLIWVKHVAKVPNHFFATKYPDLFFVALMLLRPLHDTGEASNSKPQNFTHNVECQCFCSFHRHYCLVARSSYSVRNILAGHNIRFESPNRPIRFVQFKIMLPTIHTV